MAVGEFWWYKEKEFYDTGGARSVGLSTISSRTSPAKQISAEDVFRFMATRMSWPKCNFHDIHKIGLSYR